MNTRPLILLLSSSLLAAGCGISNKEYTPVAPKETPTASVAAGSEADLMPLAEGNNWRYDLSGKVLSQRGTIPQKAEYSLECKKVETLPDGVRAHIEISKGEVLQDKQVWWVDKTGIFQEQTEQETIIKLEPRQPLIPFPLEVGKTTNWKGKGPGPGFKPTDLEMDVVNEGPEKVDTIVGTFSAYRIEGVQKGKDAKGNPILTTVATWWAPKVGLVRQKMDVKVGNVTVMSQVMMLKQFTVK